MGIFLASPVLFWQIWRFIAPGLYKHEKRILLPFSFLSSVCFLGGATFCYFIVFPPAFRFLTGYATDYLSVLPEVREYFSLSLRLLIAFGCIFELPIFMVLLAKMNIVTLSFLRTKRKYAVLIAFIVAAVITPTPDLVNQLLMAVPLIILYEVSIMAIWLFGRNPLAGFEKRDGAPTRDGMEDF